MKTISYFLVAFLIVIGMALMSATSVYAQPAPTNPTPFHGAENVTEYAILYWDVVGVTCDHYRIYLGTDPANLSLIEDWEFKYCPDLNLQPNTSYYWRIQAFIEPYSSWSPLWSFTTGDKIATAGYALDFNGTDDYVEVPYSETLNSDKFAIAFWAKVEGGQGTYRSPLTSRNGDGVCKGYMFYATPGDKWEFWAGNGASWHSLTGPDVVLGEWIHLAATYNKYDDVAKLYVNGELSASSTSFIYVPNESKPLRIGAGSTESTPPHHYFNGVIDNVYIYNNDIAQHYPDRISKLMNYPFYPYDPAYSDTND